MLCISLPLSLYIYICMYVCMYVYIYIYIYIYEGTDYAEARSQETVNEDDRAESGKW